MRNINELKYGVLESFEEGLLSGRSTVLLKTQWRIYNLLSWVNTKIRRFRFVQMNLFRKCDVLLINLPKYYEPIRHFPIGLASIASYLEKQRIKVMVVDMNSQVVGKKLLSIVVRIKKPKIVGLSGVTFQIQQAYELGKYLKRKFPHIPLVYGGVHASALPEEPFKKGSADLVVVCEGEQTLLELYRAIIDKSDLSKIDGLVYKNKKRGIIKNEPRKFIKNIDDLPIPAYHLFDVRSYSTDIHVYPYNRTIAMDLMTSRGCPHNCAYCSSPFLYRRTVRLKSPEKIVGEIEFLINKYKFKNFHFHDDDLLLNIKRIEKLCHMIIERRLNIKFICLTNINTLLKNQHILSLLKKAGCVGIEFGIESVNKGILSSINKTQDTKNLLKIANMLEKEGITPMYLVMSFNPGETLDSAYETAQMIHKMTKGRNINVSYYLQPHHHNFSLGMLATPYPGSKFYETAKYKGVVLANNYECYRPENINFVPFSFLNDTPIKRENFNRTTFFNEIKKHEQTLLCHQVGGFDIFHHRYNFDYYRYVEFLYDLYRLCDGRKKIKEISDIMLRTDKKLNMGYNCVGLRFLAMFGFIKSKKANP